MKRVKAACILQTSVFAQKPEMGHSKERALKIKAAVSNAKIFKSIQEEYGSFYDYLKQYWNGETICDSVSTRSELSDAISADLCRRGMKFMGTTIVQSFLQAVGVINAHDEKCDMHTHA